MQGKLIILGSELVTKAKIWDEANQAFGLKMSSFDLVIIGCLLKGGCGWVWFCETGGDILGVGERELEEEAVEAAGKGERLG